MAVAFDAVNNATAPSSTTSPLAWTHTPSGTPTAVYVCAGFSANTAYSAATVACTYGGAGHSMTILGGQDSGVASGGTSGFVVMFKLLSPLSGAQAVSLTWSGVTLNGGGKGVTGASVTVTGSTADGNYTPGHSTGSAASGSVALSSTVTGNLCLCAVVDGSGGLSWTAGTQRYSGPSGGDSSTGAGYDWGATLASASGTTTFTWTQTSDFWGAVAVEAQVSAGGGTTSAPAALASGTAAAQPATTIPYALLSNTKGATAASDLGGNYGSWATPQYAEGGP